MKKIEKIKSYTILPIVAIFLIAISVGDKLWSLPYLLKTIPALTLLLLSVILLTIDLRKKNQNK
jgi:hypothetical protein